MESFDEIKRVALAGRTVCWKNDAYIVWPVISPLTAQVDDWLIGYGIGTAHENWVGLHEPSYDPADFYILGG